MLRRTSLLSAGILLTTLLVLLPPPGALGQQAPEARRGMARGADRDMIALADAVPGFGGMYRDEAGRTVVYLRDFSQLPRLQARLGDVVALPAEHDFRDLHGWRIDLRSRILGTEGVVLLDVDETLNRVRIGVDPAAGEPAARAAARIAARRGIPRNAVVIVDAEPIVQVTTLRDMVRPVPGGMQIRFSNFLCTLGFNAARNGAAGFVTNSHCTDQQGGVHKRRPTLYYQPLNQTPAEFIGTERVDPDYFRRKNGCPRGAECRFSDSAWAEYDAASLSGGDTIARTTERGALSGSITIDDANPTFAVAGTGAAGVGNEVNKVGRTSGWTFGQVSATCVDTGVQGSNIVLLCQTFVDAGVGSGDSGSPVFTWTGGGTVTLVGILWGGNGDGTLFVYSPYSAVASELELD